MITEILKHIPTHYGKPAIIKAQQLIDTWYCHFSFSSPWNYRREQKVYCFKNNKLYWFRTEWARDIYTAKRFFKKWETKSKKYHWIISLQ